MFSTCISCFMNLGSNELLARLPVGRMIAYDEERGRLWVICLACRSWNLVPLEERWEAIEEADTLFRATRRRVRSEQIALAFLDKGFGLIRVGRATVPEFAAWRFGTELFGRWTRFWRAARPELAGTGLGAATSLGVAGAASALGAAPFLTAGAVLVGLPAGLIGWSRLAQRRDESPLLWLFDGSGTPRAISVMGGLTAELLPASSGGWAVSIYDFSGRMTFEGHAAWRVLAAVLSHRNRFGAPYGVIRAAVGHIETAGTPDAYVERTAVAANSRVSILPRPIRLALEISLHEHAERRALAGHLEDLTNAWREAEEVARIADSLLLPDSMTQQLDRLRGTERSGGAA